MPSLLAQIGPRIGKCSHADPQMSRCITYYEALKGTSNPSEIYRAIDSVITFLSYRRISRAKRHQKFGVFSEFYLPIIVLDGRLFEAVVNQSKVEVHERSHVQLRTFHREEIYIVDVVVKDYFQDFFNNAEQFHKELVSAIRKLKLPVEFRTAARANIKKGS